MKLLTEIRRRLRQRRFRLMCRKADDLHELTGKQYHVLVTDALRLQIVNNSYVQEYNKHANRASRIDGYWLIKHALYSTKSGRK